MEFKEKLQKIQCELKAPKNLFNKFGNYKYRNAEGICEAVKPMLEKYKLVLTMTDEIVLVGQHTPIQWEHTEYDSYKKKDVQVMSIFSDQRFYIKALVTLTDTESENSITVSAFARESEVKKGADESQITGTASSYARKYALNGLFLLDDTKDADSDEFHKAAEKKEEPKQKPNDHDVVPTEDFKAAEKITPTEIKVVEKMLADLKWKVEDVFSKPIADLTKEEYGKALQALRTNLEKLKGSK